MEQFDQLLTCAICLDRYRNPKLLPCQHSFCMEPCMEGLINYVTRQVKCPECRAEHRIPYQGIAAYPTNVTLQRFLELHIEITGELPDPTSGQIMERCGVCSEKNYCSVCCHCDKKICSDCKESHLEILRREINRVNNQVRRTLPRLHDALSTIDKNTAQLQQNCNSVIEEVETLYLRLSKALKDRTDAIKSEIEVFMAKEMKMLTGLRVNVEQEISNFDSNLEFSEKHIGAEGSSSAVAWDDNELMDAKDIFLRTMEFIRNFESETGDYHRRVRFFVPQEPNQLANTLANLGELTINYSQKAEQQPMYPHSQPPTAPSLGPGLMRSKSDHRVAAQFRQAEERYLASGGSENNDDSSVTGSRQRYFGDRHNTGRISDRYGDSSRKSDYDYDDSSADTGRRSRFRSRFMRHHDSGDSDNEPTNRSVRFHDASSDANAPKKERQRVLDTEDAARGPLSGITRLADSPRVIKKLQESETKGRKTSKPNPPSSLSLNLSATAQSTPSFRATQRTTSRQVSEEDEIAKIKKQNKSQEAQQQATGAEASATTGRKGDSSVPSTPTSAGTNRFPSSTTPAASRQTSTTSDASKQSETGSSTVTASGEDEGRNRKRSVPSKNGTTAEEPSGNSSTRTSTRSSPSSEEATDRSGRRVGRVSVDRFSKSSSESSTSAESSTHSSPVRNTGAAFSTVELKNRFARKGSTGSNNGDSGSAGTATSSTANTPSSTTTTTTRSRFGTVSSTASNSTTTPTSGRFGSGSTATAAASSSSSTSNGAAGAAATQRFTSRFLGRAGTPSAEASRVSENSQSSSSDDSSESSDSDSAPPSSSASATTGNKSGGNSTSTATTAASSTKDRELARTDIGPLLARSAQARDSYSTSSSTSSRQQTDTPSSYTTRSRANASTTGSSTTASMASSSARPYGSGSTSRFGSSDVGSSVASSSSLARSRTGTSLAEDMENKYPLTSKYLNRSRANMADMSADHSSSYGSGSSSTPRYSTTRSGYQSRFLNKSKSSAALAPEGKDADGEDDDDDEPAEEADSSSAAPSHQQQSLSVSGDERYPSGRSRYAALKDRRSRLARSKSSHEVVPDPSSPTEPSEPGRGGRSTASHNAHGQPSGEVGDTGTSSLEPTSPTAEAGSGSSLSTWARYLKNKYGPRNKEPNAEESENQQPTSVGGNRQQPNQRFNRSKSISATSANNSSNGHRAAGENDSSKDSPNHLITSPSRHNYMQKRKVVVKFGTRGSEPGHFTWPRGVAVGPDNSIVVADSSNHRVQVFDSNGRFVKEFGYYGNGEGEFDCLAGVAINGIGQYIIADRYNHRIQVFDPSGRFLRVFGSQGTSDGKFSYPWGVTTDALGFIYVCDKENHRVQVFQSDGTFVGKFGSMGNRPGQLEHPHYIAVSSTNRVIVSDSNNHRIQVFDVNGKVITTFGGEGSDEGQFKFPRGVAVDDQGYIIVADSGNNRIQVFTADGVFVKAFGCWGSGDGEFKGLEGIAVLPNGNIVVCDRENHRIQMF